MVLLPTQSAAGNQVVVKGMLFGVRGGSCSCDPCDCNPCQCGDAITPNPPLWRVSGCAIEEGWVGETDLSHLVLLSLAQPRDTGEWEEILLVENRATAEQIAGLLRVFEQELESLPAEVGPLPPTRRAVYRVPFDYRPDAARPFLRVALTQDQMTQVRASERDGESWPRAWTYEGPMALRGEIVLHS